jgi:hypothetical protein
MNEFNARFSKVYHIILVSIRPNATMALIYYLEKFDSVGMFIRNKDPQTLDVVSVVAIEDRKAYYGNQGRSSTPLNFVRSLSQENIDPSTQVLHIH